MQHVRYRGILHLLVLAARPLAVKAAEPGRCVQHARGSCAEMQVGEDLSMPGLTKHPWAERPLKPEYETNTPPSPSMVQRVLSQSKKNVDEEHAENSNTSLPAKRGATVIPAHEDVWASGHSSRLRVVLLVKAALLLLQRELAFFLPGNSDLLLSSLLQGRGGGAHYAAAVILLPMLVIGVFVVILFFRSLWSEDRHDQTGRGRMQGAAVKTWHRADSHRGVEPEMQWRQTGHLHAPSTGTVGNMRSPRCRSPTAAAGTPIPPLQMLVPERTSLSPIAATPPQAKASLTPHVALPKPYLCPELVVPENNECTLLLPEIQMGAGQGASGSSHQQSILSIDDLNGMAVLFAAYTTAPIPPPGQYDVPGHSKRLVLRSALEDVVLASCADAVDTDSSGDPGLIIFNKANEQCGVLRASSPGGNRGFMAHLTTGQKVLVRRDLQASDTYATDEDGWLLACTENAERGRVIRISPQVDAGLMTLAMLGTDLLVFGVVSRPNRPYGVY